MAARVLRRAAEAPSKAALRALLAQEAPRLGLTTAAIEEIVRQSQITYWRAGQQIFSQGESHDLANFLVAGASVWSARGFTARPSSSRSCARRISSGSARSSSGQARASSVPS